MFWREYGTEAVYALGHQVATFGAKVKSGGIVDEYGPVVWSDDMELDNEVSPTFIEKEDGYLCLAMHLQFHSKWIKRQMPALKRLLTKLLAVTDLLGFGSQQKSFGIARWFSEEINRPFKYRDTVKFKNCNSLYRPWHMDFFEYQGRLYAIVQTNQCNADLCLAYSEDYEHFTFFKKPLITNATIGKLGIYKPTAGVVDDTFFLYYTAQDADNRALNKLYMTKIEYGQLCSLIQ